MRYEALFKIVVEVENAEKAKKLHQDFLMIWWNM